MAVKIDKNRCISCNRCVDVCPGNLLFLDRDEKAEICDSKECWDCSACVKECPVQAIGMYLPPEVGGSGSILKVSETGDTMAWKIVEKGRVVEDIEINKKDSNKF